MAEVRSSDEIPTARLIAADREVAVVVVACGRLRRSYRVSSCASRAPTRQGDSRRHKQT